MKFVKWICRSVDMNFVKHRNFFFEDQDLQSFVFNVDGVPSFETYEALN